MLLKMGWVNALEKSGTQVGEIDLHGIISRRYQLVDRGMAIRDK